MVATFPIDHQAIVRAAEEMISDYGSQALAKAKKRAQELKVGRIRVGRQRLGSDL